MANTLVFGSCGRENKFHSESNPKNIDSTGSYSYSFKRNFVDKDIDDDSLWNGVINDDEQEPCGTSVGEDNTLEITNRGYLSKPKVRGDEESLRSLISTDPETTTAASTSSDSRSIHSAPSQVSHLVQLSEEISARQEDVIIFHCQGESHYDDCVSSVSINAEDKASMYQFAPAAQFAIEKNSFWKDVQSYKRPTTTSTAKRMRSRDTIWKDFIDSPSSLLASVKKNKQEIFSPATQDKRGFSIRKQEKLSAVVNKMKSKGKKASQKLRSLRENSENIIANMTSTIRSEYNAAYNAPNECQQRSKAATRKKQRQQSTWRHGRVELVMEKILLKPDHRGRLNMQSNMEGIIGSIDPNDCRHFVVGVTSGFEVVPPPKRD